MCTAVHIANCAPALRLMLEKDVRNVAQTVHLVSFSPRDLLKLLWKSFLSLRKFSFISRVIKVFFLCPYVIHEFFMRLGKMGGLNNEVKRRCHDVWLKDKTDQQHLANGM